MVRMRGAVPAEIWVLVAAAFVIAIGYGLIAPILPAFAASFDVGVTGASIVISAFAFSRLVFAPSSGALVSRVGERWVYLTGLAIVAGGQLITAFAPNLWVLITSRIVGGIGSTMFTVSAMGLLVRLTPPDVRGRVSSLYASSFLLGGVLGPVLGGLLVGFGMRLPFIAYAVSLVIAMIVVWAKLPPDDRSVDAGTIGQAPMTVSEAATHPSFRAALASNFANGWTNFGVRVAHVPLLISITLQVDPWVAGAAMAVFAAGNGIAIIRSGRIADLRGRRPLVMLGLGVCGLATAGLGWAHSVWGVLALSAIAGFGIGIMGPAQQAAVADIIGNNRAGGKVLAAFQMSADLGAIIGPIAGGLLADHYGFEWAFAISGALLIAAIPLWLRAPETRP